MFSKRSLEGYFLRDNSVAGGAKEEFPIATCSHCQRGVIINPGRIRDRAYCPKCDHYVCDECEAVRAQTGECKTFNQIIDEVQEAAISAKSRLII